MKKRTRVLFILKGPPVRVALLFFCMTTAKFPSYIASTQDLVRKILIFTRDPNFCRQLNSPSTSSPGADGISYADGNNYLGGEGLLHAWSNISLKLKPPTDTFQTLRVIYFGEYALSYISFCIFFSKFLCNHQTYSPAN